MHHLHHKSFNPQTRVLFLRVIMKLPIDGAMSTPNDYQFKKKT